jgi:glycosyltransferase involved in cell wall biosynthesis
MRRRLSIATDAPVGLFCGALTTEKELDFLIAATEQIRVELPSFELVIIGDGPNRSFVEEAARQQRHVHYVGPAFGPDRAPYFAIANVFVMPALVGLALVDAFAAGLPLFTTALTTHGPEIEYLAPGENGVIAPHDVRTFARAVTAALADRGRLDHMRAAARATASRLTLSHMVGAFEAGILGCLSTGRDGGGSGTLT